MILEPAVHRAFADPISIQTIVEVRMVPNAVPSCNTFCVRDIQEKASNECHSAFSGLECCSEKGKTFQSESANPQLWREVESRPNLKMIKNHVFDNAQCCDTFFCRDLCNKRG